MIFTDRKITIRNGKSTINEPVILYRGDYEVSIKFTIMESKFRFKSGVNLVDSEKASHGQLAILAPYGGNVFSEIVKCEDGTVTFTLTKEMIDQLEEVGLCSFQIRLFDYYRESRVSIPPVEFGIEVREPVASEDHDNEVNNAIVGYSIAKVVDPKEENVGDTFNSNGQYNKTDWETGDRITEGKLNKIEDALDKINQNEIADVAALDKRVTNNFNVLDNNKADKNEIFSMKNMGQDIKEAMTGGSVAVVGTNAVLRDNVADRQITPEKTSFIDRPNLFIVSDITDNTFIMHNSGTSISNEKYAVSDFIEVVTGETYIFNYGGPSEFLTFYDDNKNYIGGRQGEYKYTEVTINDKSIKYMRVNVSKANQDINAYGVYPKTCELVDVMVDGKLITSGIDGSNLLINSITNDKLEGVSKFILDTLCANFYASNTMFEFGLINSDGSYSNNISGAITLHNVRTNNIVYMKEMTIELLTDNVMVKIVYYDEYGAFIEASNWMSRIQTQWTTGGVDNIQIKDSYIAICMADTAYNSTDDFVYEVDDIISRVDINANMPINEGDVFITGDNIAWNTINMDDNLDKTCVIDGPMSLPTEFGVIPFEIIRENNKYNISVSSEQLNLKPTIVYVSSNGSGSGLGDDINNPVTLYAVKQNFINNSYPSKNIKIIFTENTYFINSISNFDMIGTGQDDTVTNITFESGCGFTWIGYGDKDITWEKHSDELYKYYCEQKVSDLVDLENLKSNGMPDLYVKKSSLSEVTKEGEFCQIDNMIYVYPRSTNDINKINIIFGFDYTTSISHPGILTIRKSSRGNVVFKNIGTLLDSLNMRDLRSLDVWCYFFGCRFHRDSMDSFALNGKYKAVLIDCIADYGSKDNFNYHSTSKDSVAIELNCKSYGAGQYKLDTVGVNTTTDSCNGSTAHNGMCVARFGCSYWDCEGSVVADVNNCVTYCVECSVKNILSTISNANYKAAFMMHDNRYAGSNPLRPEYNHENYLISCQGGGDNVTWGVRSEGVKINIGGFKGNREYYQENDNDINNINSIK